MTSANADRQRRYRERKRAHNAGDHSLCGSAQDCGEAPPALVTPVTAPPVARNGLRELKQRGRRLWDDLKGDTLAGGRRVLLEEACRLADRLDGLDLLISGDAQDWLDIVETKGNPDRQELVIDKLLAEARQQAIALKQIVAELRQTGDQEQSEQEGDGLDQLAARRAARLADAANR